ncbi:MAG: DUF4390 domain-containing protein [Granulosicoccus sp.]
MSFLPAQPPVYPLRCLGGVKAIFLWALLGSGLAALGIYGWLYLQSAPVDGQGNIQLSDIKVSREANELVLRANARVRLPSTIQAGLDSGVPLTFVLGLRVFEPMPWLPDRTVIEHERHYKLTYYELTRHYRVLAVESNISRNFRSLSSALSGLGELGLISFTLDEQQVQQIEQTGLVGSLSMRLSKSALPLPLQPIIRSSWTLVSEEYRWPVT